jgi:CheY-like chemotaxis protein
MTAKVMVVDDDADLQMAVADILEDAGYQVTTAHHGAMALELLRKGEPPDVVLLDVMMPVMSGPELAEVMRADPELQGIPIIVFTAHADATRVAEESHAAASLKKPLRAQQLLDTVAQIAQGPGADGTAGAPIFLRADH